MKNNRITYYSLYIIGFLSCFTTTLTLAADESPRAFESVYVGTSLNSTYPTSFSEDYYSSGGTSPTFHYRYFMKNDWLVGASLGFKILKDLEGSDSPLFTLEQKTTKIFRIYYPAWLGVGASMLYLVGVEKVNFPYQRNRDVPTQVGVGVHAMLLYKFGPKWVGHIELNRWRGTMNNRLHVVETGLGVTYEIGIR